MASVTVQLTGYDSSSIQVYWSDNVSLGTVFSPSGFERILEFVGLADAGGIAGRVDIGIQGAANDLTAAFEATGRIIFEASDGETLEVQIANADMTEPYQWTPSNSAEVIAFANHVRGLTDQDATLTLTDDPPNVAPSFVDATGDAQTWTAGTQIAPITVPAATGTPTPTYAVKGTLPAGIVFNATTRVISGTPTAVGAGTITIEASNSEGTANWTVDYATAAALAAPSFTDNTGDPQAWIQGQTITPLTVPTASGNPAPTYAAVGALPAGIAFNAASRVISGTPTAQTSGRILIQATNNQGTADWTVDYSTTAPPVLLTLADFNDDGLEVETAALLQASAPGTSGNNFYVDVSRGGSGTPIEGELGVGPGETIIDRFRRASTANLTLNDSNSPVTLDFNTFFGTGGDGRDLTVYLQTASDGLVSFTVASAFLNAGGNWLNLTLPVAGRTLLNNLATGERFIFALARLQVIETPPAFADDTGTPQTWFQNQAITPITVPDAGGDPAPTYTAVGSLPAGIVFNTTTKVISGTPTVEGSGTIRIRATNSQGSDDWTVTFTTTTVLSTSDWDGTGYQAPIALGLIPAVISEPDITEQDFTPIGMADIVIAANVSIGQVERRASGIRLLRTSSSTGGFSSYFDNEGTPLYPDAKLFLVVRDSFNTSVTIPFTIGGTGFTFNNWTIDDSNQTALVDGLVTGDRFVLAIAEPAIAPSFTDDTGDAQTWTQGDAITPITVPEADGSPTPAYLAVGTLPAGIAFNTGTRVISGTPTAAGSGTITIQASNSEGNADWSVAYTTSAAFVAPFFVDDTGDTQSWTVGNAIAPLTVPEATGNPAPSYAAVGALPAGIAFTAATRVISGTPSAVGAGTITIRATNSQGADDWTVDYASTSMLVAPSFADNTGAPQDWTQSTTITPLTVPLANGNPTPTYTVVGTLPAGINFNPTTRAISGTPTVVGSGTITVRATNNQGTADWTVAYTTRVALAAPSFADDTGVPQDWVQGTAITPVTVPLANGNPAPSYGAVGALPAGISFDKDTRVISGAPNALGSGTITIRATNPQGNADWTVAYTTRAAFTAPSFADDTGDAQNWTQSTAITPVTVPTASGNPAPTYAAVGALPAGILFDTLTRVISGTPTTPGSGTITIRATNSEGSADWTVDYTTTALVIPNVPPTARAGADLSASAGVPVTLNGTGSNDLDGTIASYAWAQTAGDTVALAFGHTATPSFTNPSTPNPQTLTFQLTVTDDDGATGTDSVNVYVLAMAAPTFQAAPYRVEIDWDGDGTFGHPDADVYDDMVGFYCERGRNYEDMVFGRSEAGKLDMLLTNDDGQYDRYNTNSPLHGLVVPGRLIKYSMYNPLTLAFEVQWGGQLWNVERIPSNSGNDHVRFSAYGHLVDLRQEISVPMQTAIGTPDALTAVLDAAQVPAIKRGSITGARTMARWWSPLQRGIEAARSVEETEVGFILEEKTGRIGMQEQDLRLSGRHRTSRATFDADSITGIPVDMADPSDPAKDIANIIQVPLRRYSVGAEEVLWSLTHTVELEPGDSLTFSVEYPTVGTPGRVLAVNTWTTMTPVIDYTANSQPDGLGTDLTTNLSVSTAPGTDTAAAREIIISNTGLVDLVVTRLQARGTPLSDDGTTTIMLKDQPSIDDYDPQPYTVPAQFIANVTDARAYARFLLRLVKDPQTRAPIEFEASDHMAEVLDLDLSDRVQLILDGTHAEYFVEFISHSLEPGQRHDVGFNLSPVLPYGETFVFGQSALGTGVFGL